MSAIGWILSIGGWFFFNLLIGELEKSNSVYDVHDGFIDRFGNNILWWLILILIVSCVCVFETIESAFRQLFFPTDVDVFRALEKDGVLQQRFAESAEGRVARDVQGKEKVSIEEEDEREREIRELLARPRVMGEVAENGGELHRRHVSSDALGSAGSEVGVNPLSPLSSPPHVE